MTAAHYIFVLWGRNFDEAAATIFVTELRQAGRRVKVVGLDGELPVGMNGLALAPDIPLSKALPYANRTICVIVPCQAGHWPRLQQDPRLVDLISDSQQAGAILVVEAKQHERQHEWSDALNGLIERVKSAVPAVKLYPAHEELTCFARELAKSLQC
ncbi:MAG TPA: hypothetical protein P5121_15185 [Caldilineaceae bacterium]|nr:hypothetical protein [Caldilineaceae bacterium]